MECERCGKEIKEGDIFYLIEVTKKYSDAVNNPDIGYPEMESEMCEYCGESTMFILR